MKRVIFLFSFLLFVHSAYSQSIWLYSANGHVEHFGESGNWQAVGEGVIGLMPIDSLRMYEHSSVTILDSGKDEIYAIQKVGSYSVSDLVCSLKKQKKHTAKELISFLWSSFRGGSEIDKFRSSAGVVYRDTDNSAAIAESIRHGEGNLKVEFELLRDDIKTPFGCAVRAWDYAYIKVVNYTHETVFVGLIDIDSNGLISNLLPVGSARQMSKLFIPPYSEVVLDSFPIVFSEPLGTDQLVLVACVEYFDMERVIEALKMNRGCRNNAKIGISVKEMCVMVR